jgi:hypothetical protein
MIEANLPLFNFVLVNFEWWGKGGGYSVYTGIYTDVQLEWIKFSTFKYMIGSSILYFNISKDNTVVV